MLSTALDAMCVICRKNNNLLISEQEILGECKQLSVTQVLKSLNLFAIKDVLNIRLFFCFVCVAKIQYCFEFQSLCSRIEEELIKQAEELSNLSSTTENPTETIETTSFVNNEVSNETISVVKDRNTTETPKEKERIEENFQRNDIPQEPIEMIPNENNEVAEEMNTEVKDENTVENLNEENHEENVLRDLSDQIQENKDEKVDLIDIDEGIFAKNYKMKNLDCHVDTRNVVVRDENLKEKDSDKENDEVKDENTVENLTEETQEENVLKDLRGEIEENQDEKVDLIDIDEGIFAKNYKMKNLDCHVDTRNVAVRDENLKEKDSDKENIEVKDENTVDNLNEENHEGNVLRDLSDQIQENKDEKVDLIDIDEGIFAKNYNIKNPDCHIDTRNAAVRNENFIEKKSNKKCVENGENKNQKINVDEGTVPKSCNLNCQVVIRNEDIISEKSKFPLESTKNLQKEPHKEINTVSKTTKDFHCKICNKSFSFLSRLKAHSIRKHKKEINPKPCVLCDKSFLTTSQLNKHKLVHCNKKKISCSLCGKIYKRRDSLTNHMRIHTGETPYKCHICRASFRKKINLTVHMTKHTGSKRYSCDICGKSFNWQDCLNKHQRIHSGDKPFECKVCEKKFRSIGNLSAHSPIHVKGKPLRCDICGKGFKVDNYLRKHKNWHAKEQNILK